MSDIPQTYPDHPHGNQAWLMMKYSLAQTEQANISAMLFRLQAMKKIHAPPNTLDENNLEDVIEYLEIAQERMQAYINALESVLHFE